MSVSCDIQIETDDLEVPSGLEFYDYVSSKILFDVFKSKYCYLRENLH